MQDKQTVFDQDAPIIPRVDTVRPSDDFDDIIGMQINQASRRVNEQTPTEATLASIDTPEQETSAEKRKGRLKRIGRNTLVATLTVGSVVGLGLAFHEATKMPEFSENTTTYTVQNGDGLQNAAEEVEGSNTVRIKDVEYHIAQLPENKDTLSGGLQPGEQLIIPESIKGFENTEE